MSCSCRLLCAMSNRGHDWLRFAERKKIMMRKDPLLGPLCSLCCSLPSPSSGCIFAFWVAWYSTLTLCFKFLSFSFKPFQVVFSYFNQRSEVKSSKYGAYIFFKPLIIHFPPVLTYFCFYGSVTFPHLLNSHWVFLFSGYFRDAEIEKYDPCIQEITNLLREMDI